MSQKRKAASSPRVDSEESISRYFKPVTPPSVKRRRLTERQKEAILENREKLGALLDTDSTNNLDSNALVEKKVASGFYVGNDDTQNENALDSTPVKKNVKASPAKNPPAVKSPSPANSEPTDFSALSKSTEEKEKSPSRSPSSSPSRPNRSSRSSGVHGNIFDEPKSKNTAKDTTPLSSPQVPSSAESKAALTLKKIEEKKRELREKAAEEKSSQEKAPQEEKDDRRKSTPKKLHAKMSAPKSKDRNAKEAETTPKSKKGSDQQLTPTSKSVDLKKVKHADITPKLESKRWSAARSARPSEDGKTTPISTPNKGDHNETPRSSKSSAKRNSRPSRGNNDTPIRPNQGGTPKASRAIVEILSDDDEDLTPKAIQKPKSEASNTKNEKPRESTDEPKKNTEETKKKPAEGTPPIGAQLSDDEATPKAVPSNQNTTPIDDTFSAASPDVWATPPQDVEMSEPSVVPNTPPVEEKKADKPSELMDSIKELNSTQTEPAVPADPTPSAVAAPQRQRTPSPLPSILKKSGTPSPSRNLKHVRFDTGNPDVDQEFTKEKNVAATAAPVQPTEDAVPLCADLVNCKDIIRPIAIIELAAKGQFLQLKRVMDARRIQTIGDLAKQPRSLLDGLACVKDVESVVTFLNQYNDTLKTKANGTLSSPVTTTTTVAAVSTTIETPTETTTISSIAAATQLIAAAVAKSRPGAARPKTADAAAKSTDTSAESMKKTEETKPVEVKTEEIIVDSTVAVDNSRETVEAMDCDIQSLSLPVPSLESLVAKISDAVAEKFNLSELLKKFAQNDDNKIVPLAEKIAELNENYVKFEKEIGDVKQIITKMSEPQKVPPQEDESAVSILTKLKATLGSRLQSVEDCRRVSTLLIGLLNDVDTYSRTL